MNARIWVIPTTIAIVIAIPLATFIGYLIYEVIMARRNRIYKSLEHHTILNAGNREDWIKGTLPSGDGKELSRFSTLIAPVVQLATIIVLAVVIVVSNGSLTEQVVRQQDQISSLEAQIHALAFTGAGEPAAIKSDPDPAAPIQFSQAAPAPPSPMQQACANLIGRVADAYEKGESSKIALSLEDLVRKLNCVNGMPP
jgi:hypothetical protein